MRICFVAPADNYHTKKWCEYFVSRGYEVHVISFTYGDMQNVDVHHIDLGVTAQSSDIGKLKYLCSAGKVRKIIEQIHPDIINAHYASSYGSVMALTGLKGYVVSVWGSDVYDFPNKSIFHTFLLKYALKKARYIFSTSKAMAEETHKYTDKPIEITPFGVKVDLFNPNKRTRGDDGKFIVGTVKTLSPKYGIDYLVKAVALSRKQRPDINLELRIAGKGTHEKAYKQLACDLGIDDITKWLGFISQEQAAQELVNMDVAVIPSLQESFGVSAVETQACGVATIISNVPGLMEATRPGFSSIVVPRENSEALAEKIVELYDNLELRKQLGSNGRKFVLENYEYNMCFEKIGRLFEGIVGREKSA